MTTQMKLRQRFALLFCPPVLIILTCVYIFSGRYSIQCPFYELTGLYCPGCGSGRTIYSLLHGKWENIFQYNIILLPLGIPASLILLHEFFRITIPALNLKPIFIPQWLTVSICILIFLFWILRNIHFLSFLAP